jgi:hypothetical protein
VFTLRSYGGTDDTSCPSSNTCPQSGASKPATNRRQVVFPEPEGPSMAKNSPGSIENDTSSTARTSPNTRETPRNSIAAVMRRPSRYFPPMMAT